MIKAWNHGAMSIPMLLTALRIILIPVFVAVFYLPWQEGHFVAAVIFTMAAITDWFDGHMARTLGQTTSLGRFLDPVADKLLVAVALVLVVAENYMPYLTIPVAIILGREIVISALREWMAEVGKRTSVAVTMVAKLKTLIQMIALVALLLYRPGYAAWIQWVGYILLYLAAGLTLWSMVMYITVAWPDLTLPRENQ